MARLAERLASLANLYWLLWLVATLPLGVALALGHLANPRVWLVLTLAFLLPELVFVVAKRGRLTLSGHLWRWFPSWPTRYAIGFYLGYLCTHAAYIYIHPLAALAGGFVTVWLSTPHMIAKKAFV